MSRTGPGLAAQGVPRPSPLLSETASDDALLALLAVCHIARADSMSVGGEVVARLLARGFTHGDLHTRSGVAKSTQGRWLRNYQDKNVGETQ